MPSRTSKPKGADNKQINGSNKKDILSDPGKNKTLEKKKSDMIECSRTGSKESSRELARGKHEPGRGSHLSKGPETLKSMGPGAGGKRWQWGQGQMEWPDSEGGLQGAS